MPTALVLRSLDDLSDAIPSWADRAVDSSTRAAIEIFGVAFLCAKLPSLTAKGAALVGTAALAIGALISAVSLSMGVQKGAHFLMSAGLYVMQTSGTALVALGASACAAPANRRVVTLLAFHGITTLAPRILPLLDWLATGGLSLWAQLLLFPLILVALVPHLDQLVAPLSF